LELGLKGHKLGKILCRAPKQKRTAKYPLCRALREKKIVPPPVGANGSPSVSTWATDVSKKIVCRAPKKCTAKYFFTVRFSLSCALYKTHGKEALCRAPDRKRTAKVCFPVVNSSAYKYTPCSLGLSTTSQQYFFLRTNQPPVLFS
jgi:hypothetical protein